MVSLGAPLENGEGMKRKPSPLVELNPNMLVRDVERMSNSHLMLPQRQSRTMLADHGKNVSPLYSIENGR